MINFDKLFNIVLKENHITIYRLYTYLGVSKSQIYRIKEGRCQIATLNTILQLLYEETGHVYQLNDICEFVPEPTGQVNASQTHSIEISAKKEKEQPAKD